MEQVKDDRLWKIAKRRAAFKIHLAAYMAMSIFFWLIWFFTSNHYPDHGYPWPIWPMIGWGIGLVAHFTSAYGFYNSNSTEREYNKLVQKEAESKKLQG